MRPHQGGIPRQHEPRIRTPLNAIVRNDAARARHPAHARTARLLDTVRASSEALIGIVNDILDFSKIESRRLQVERVAFDVRETLEDAIRAVALRAQEKGLELACHIHTGVPAVVFGDPGRLRQVVINLVGNAVKFTEQGEVLLDVERQTCEDERALLGFAVSDTGIGISADKREHIFQAFAQADSSTTRRYGGTGLGLTISSELVSMMGGSISVESELGRGSTFRFTAWFDVEPETTRQSRPAEPASLTVCACSRSTTTRHRGIVHEMLESWRMRPESAASGPDALAALARADAAGEPFALVLVDGQMPDMDGFTLARRIKADRRFQSLPIVMLTSMGQTGATGRRDEGIAATITKPVKHSDLLDAIATVLDARGKPEAERRRPKSAGAARPLRMLVADDSAVNRKLVIRVLERRGHHTVEAADGRCALEPSTPPRRRSTSS